MKEDSIKHSSQTDAGIWKEHDDNRLPNPGPSMDTVKKLLSERMNRESAKSTLKAQTILAYELEENPDSFRAVATGIIDSYNKANTLTVFGEKKQEESFEDSFTKWIKEDQDLLPNRGIK